MRTTAHNIPMKRGVWVGRVPALAGTTFFFAKAPAIAKTGTMIQKRLIHMRMPPSQLWNGTLPLKPPKAEPLLLAMLE